MSTPEQLNSTRGRLGGFSVSLYPCEGQRHGPRRNSASALGLRSAGAKATIAEYVRFRVRRQHERSLFAQRYADTVGKKKKKEITAQIRPGPKSRREPGGGASRFGHAAVPPPRPAPSAAAAPLREAPGDGAAAARRYCRRAAPRRGTAAPRAAPLQARPAP